MVSTNQDLDIRYALPHLAFANSFSSLWIELESHLLLIHAYSNKSTTSTQNHGVPFRIYLFLILQNVWLGSFLPPTSTTYSSSWYASVHILPNIKAHTFDKCSKSCHQLQSSTPNSSLSQIWLTLTLSTPLVSKYHMNAISFCSPPNMTSFTCQEAFRVHSAPVCLGK